MSTSTTAMRGSASLTTTPQFWERLWRSAGVQSVGLFVVAYFADDVSGIWSLAGRTDLKRAVRGRRCGCGAPSAGRNHLAERRILGTRRSVLPDRITTYLALMPHGRQPRPLEPRSSYPRRMVIEANYRRSELRTYL